MAKAEIILFAFGQTDDTQVVLLFLPRPMTRTETELIANPTDVEDMGISEVMAGSVFEVRRHRRQNALALIPTRIESEAGLRRQVDFVAGIMRIPTQQTPYPPGRDYQPAMILRSDWLWVIL